MAIQLSFYCQLVIGHLTKFFTRAYFTRVPPFKTFIGWKTRAFRLYHEYSWRNNFRTLLWCLLCRQSLISAARVLFLKNKYQKLYFLPWLTTDEPQNNTCVRGLMCSMCTLLQYPSSGGSLLYCATLTKNIVP